MDYTNRRVLYAMIVACSVKCPFFLKIFGTAIVKSLVGDGESSGCLYVHNTPYGHVFYIHVIGQYQYIR